MDKPKGYYKPGHGMTWREFFNYAQDNYGYFDHLWPYAVYAELQRLRDAEVNA